MERAQRVAGRGLVPALARGLSLWGEHSAGWLVTGLVGAACDRPRRTQWLTVGASAFAAHAAAVLLKRVVRRPRPSDRRVIVYVRTPSDLSFPSAHATSTAAAAVALAPMIGAPAAVGTVASMMFARVLLGVHYPSDVVAGAALGFVTARVVRVLTPAGARSTR